MRAINKWWKFLRNLANKSHKFYDRWFVYEIDHITRDEIFDIACCGSIMMKLKERQVYFVCSIQ